MMEGPAFRRRLTLLVGDRRQLLLIAAVVLAAAIPGLAVASSSPAPQGVGSTADPLGFADAPLSQAQPAATPQGWGGVTATVDPNPAPMSAVRSFHVTASWATDCWDDRGHYGFPDFQFSMTVSSSFTWNVACYPSGGDTIQVVVLPHPIGYINAVDANGTVTGWTCDPDNTDAALPVELRIDGWHVATVTAGEWGGQGVADQCRGNPFHQFTFSIPQQWKDGALHSISALALDHGGANHQTLNGSPQGFIFSPPPPMNTVAPTISPSTIQQGQTLTSTSGSWTGSQGPFLYTWWRGSVAIPGTVDQASPSYVVQPLDVGQTIRSSVRACNQTCSAGTFSSNSVVPTAAPPPPVWIDEYSQGNYVVFRNQEARYYIGLRCATDHESIGSWKVPETRVGPGYISKVERLVGGQAIVAEPTDGERLLQGVGVFGTHIAIEKGSQRVWGVANGNYCWEDIGGVQMHPGRAGVRSWSVVTAPTVQGDTGMVTVEVIIGDVLGDVLPTPQQIIPNPTNGVPANLLKIRYEIRVKPTVVYQWTTVTVLCGNGQCRQDHKYFVKEPKIAVTLNGVGNDYTRTSCWDSSMTWPTSAAAFNWRPDPPTGDAYRQYAKWVGTDPEAGTMRCVHGSAMPSSTASTNTRGRVLFDYGGETPPTAATQPSSATCVQQPASGQTCFVVVGRAFTPHGGPGSQLSRWEGTGTSFSGSFGSFDQWALKSAAAERLPAGLDPSDPKCLQGPSGPPSANSNSYASNDNRRWEIYGDSHHKEHGALFKAWEGGRGPNCATQLYAKLGAENSSWGAFNAYSFGSGWESTMVNPPPS